MLQLKLLCATTKTQRSQKNPTTGPCLAGRSESKGLTEVWPSTHGGTWTSAPEDSALADKNARVRSHAARRKAVLSSNPVPVTLQMEPTGHTGSSWEFRIHEMGDVSGQARLTVLC